MTEVSFDEALVRTKFGKFNYGFILFTGNVIMCAVYQIIGLVFFLPFAECDLNITSKQDYAIINIFAYTGLAMSFFFWGFLADTKGRRKVMLPALIASLVFTVLSSFAQSFWFYTICRFFIGFFVGAAATIGIVYMGEFFCDKHRSTSILVACSADGIIGILLPLCAYFIVNMEWQFYVPVLDMVYRPWRLFVLFCGLPSFITVLVLIFCLPESPKFLYNKGNEEETLKVLQKVYRSNTGKTDYNVSKITDSELGVIKNITASEYLSKLWSQIKELFRKSYIRSTIVLCYLQFGAISFPGGLSLYFPKILHQTSTYLVLLRNDNNLTLCGIQDFMSEIGGRNSSAFEFEHVDFNCIEKMGFSSFGYPMMIEAGFSLAYLLVGGFVKYVKIWILSNVIYMICTIVAIALIFCTIPILSNIMYIILILAAVNYNLIIAAAVNMYPTSTRSTAISITLIFGRLGTILGSYAVGFSFDYYCDLAFIIIAVLYASCVAAPHIGKMKKV